MIYSNILSEKYSSKHRMMQYSRLSKHQYAYSITVIIIGRKMVVIEKHGTIHIIPVGSISSVRGIANGISSRGIRDETERFE